MLEIEPDEDQKLQNETFKKQILNLFIQISYYPIIHHLFRLFDWFKIRRENVINFHDIVNCYAYDP